MIIFTVVDGKPTCIADSRDRITVYLDNDSLIDLAKGDQARLHRFVNAVKHGGDFLFSLTNVMEIMGPQEDSARAVSEFLNCLGPYWTPLEMNPFKVVDAERTSCSISASVSLDFIRIYVQSRMDENLRGGKALIDISEKFFKLGSILNQAQKDKDDILALATQLDAYLRKYLSEMRKRYEEDHFSLDRAYPLMPFNPNFPAYFALSHIIRILVTEAKAFQFKKNDGPDFCHAVVAAAYSNIAALDKQWKRRVEQIPFPKGYTSFYYRFKIDKLLDHLESCVLKLKN